METVSQNTTHESITPNSHKETISTSIGKRSKYWFTNFNFPNIHFNIHPIQNHEKIRWMSWAI